MAIKIDGKRALVEEISNAAGKAVSGVVADSRGVTVDKMDALRKEARENDVWLKVVRNTLAKRALKGGPFESLSDSFVGPSIIAFSNGHPGAGARILSDFAKNNEALTVKRACFEGAIVDALLLASLPTYDEAVARFLNVMKEAAAGKLVRTIAAIRDQKESQAA